MLMQCEQARQLFDAYLDGELSESLITEVNAHRVRCADCRRELAILEVTGHIIASDRDSEVTGVDFSDRLLACMSRGSTGWRRLLRRSLPWVGPLAAAAVIGMAMLGAFDSRPSPQVAGQKDFARMGVAVSEMATKSVEIAVSSATTSSHPELDRFLNQVQRSYETKQQSGESLQDWLNLTVLQLLEMLNAAKELAPDSIPLPPTSDRPPIHDSGDIEDL